MSMIEVTNLSDNIDFSMKRILELAEELGNGRLTKKQQKAEQVKLGEAS